MYFHCIISKKASDFCLVKTRRQKDSLLVYMQTTNNKLNILTLNAEEQESLSITAYADGEYRVMADKKDGRGVFFSIRMDLEKRKVFIRRVCGENRTDMEMEL